MQPTSEPVGRATEPACADVVLRRNLARVRATIEAACRKSGRAAAEIRLVAVTKYVRTPIAAALVAAGVCDLGESRVQQLAARAAELGGAVDESPFDAAPAAARVPRWHQIGHVQRNKVRQLLRHARIVHSLDSERLAAELETEARSHGWRVDAFVEVNVAAEASKSGLPRSGVEAWFAACAALPHVCVRGLMTMAPFDADPERARPVFAALRALRDDLLRRGLAPPTCVHLSMGMTQDYAVAIEEGATFIRVGSALFEGLTPEVAA